MCGNVRLGKIALGVALVRNGTNSPRVETPYPDKITDFDEFMQENKIFSHAFTDLRTLRYTTDIEL